MKHRKGPFIKCQLKQLPPIYCVSKPYREPLTFEIEVILGYDREPFSKGSGKGSVTKDARTQLTKLMSET